MFPTTYSILLEKTKSDSIPRTPLMSIEECREITKEDYDSIPRPPSGGFYTILMQVKEDKDAPPTNN
jgi:hypothetical protein